MIRVFHCDDSPAFRRLVGLMLDEHDDIELVGEAFDRDGVLSGLAETRPDVLLLDMVPGVSDADLGAALLAAAPGVRIVVLSGHPPERIDPGIRSVAVAHVTKSTASAELTQAIRAAATHRTNVG